MKNFDIKDVVIILVVIVCVAIFVKSYGRHLDRMSNNYEDPKKDADAKKKNEEI